MLNIYLKGYMIEMIYQAMSFLLLLMVFSRGSMEGEYFTSVWIISM